MKKSTLKRIKYLKKQLNNPKYAYAWIESKEKKLYFTYPVGGWMNNTEENPMTPDEVLAFLENTNPRIVMGSIKGMV